MLNAHPLDLHAELRALLVRAADAEARRQVFQQESDLQMHREPADQVIIVEHEYAGVGHDEQVVDQAREQRFVAGRGPLLQHRLGVPAEARSYLLQCRQKVSKEARRVTVACIEGKPGRALTG